MPQRPKTMTYTAAGGVVVNTTGDSVLLLVRPSRDEVRLPKGHVEPDESTAEAALRETQEEAGYADLDIVADLGSQHVTFLLDGVSVERDEVYFLMRARTLRQLERPPADEKQFVAVWVTWDQAESHLTFEAEQEWLRRAQRAWERQPAR